MLCLFRNQNPGWFRDYLVQWKASRDVNVGALFSGPAPLQSPARTPPKDANGTYLLHGKNPLMDCLRRHAIVGRWKACEYHLHILPKLLIVLFRAATCR